MRRIGAAFWLGWGALVLASCGVPAAALEQARVEAAALGQMPATDAEVRAALADQAQQWEAFAALAQRRELGGIGPVSADFPWLAQQTAAIAQRQADLMAQGQDDPATNRAMLQELAARWLQVEKYLEQ